MPNLISRTEWIRRANAIHGNKYDYSLWPDDIRSKDKLLIKCPEHGIFNQQLSSHLQGRKCSRCANNIKSSNLSKGIKFFKERFVKIHNNKYDYSLWLETDYLKSKYHDKIPIICPLHGKFHQTIANHTNKSGCPKCGTITAAKKKRVPIKDIIVKCIETHGNLYDYSFTHQVDNYSINKISIICRIHGQFEQLAPDHIKGSHCPKCGRENSKKTCLSKYGVECTLQSDIVKEKLKQTNMERYGVEHHKQAHIPKEILQYLNDKDWMYEQHITKEKSLMLIGNELGVGDGTVGRYLHNHNIETQRYGHSLGEIEVLNFIKILNIETISNTRMIIPPLELDIYIPTHNLAIEYCGLYWHSEQAGKDKIYHENKFNLCKMLDIQLITIFEDEWFNRQEQVKGKLKSLLRKDDSPIVYARKTQIIKVSKQPKKIFFNKNHIQGDGSSSINIGLANNDKLVACMSFIKTKDEYTLNRYATSCRVIGGFSKLLKHFIDEYEPKSIISFADLRWSTGNLYLKTGWVVDKHLLPDYSYSPDAKQRAHKFRYRRKNLPKLLNDFDPELSERINCDNNGILRIWDCGKIRFKYIP